MSVPVPVNLGEATLQFRQAKRKNATYITKIDQDLKNFPPDTIVFEGGNVVINNSKIPVGIKRETTEFVKWLSEMPFTQGGNPKEIEHLKNQNTILAKEKADLGAVIATLKTDQTRETAGLNASLIDKGILIIQLENDKAGMESEASRLKGEHQATVIANKTLEAENARLKIVEATLAGSLQTKTEEITSLKAAMTSEKERLDTENDDLKRENTGLKRKGISEKRDLVSEKEELEEEITRLKKKITSRQSHAGQESSANEGLNVFASLGEASAEMFMQGTAMVFSAFKSAARNKRPRSKDGEGN